MFCHQHCRSSQSTTGTENRRNASHWAFAAMEGLIIMVQMMIVMMVQKMVMHCNAFSAIIAWNRKDKWCAPGLGSLWPPRDKQPNSFKIYISATQPHPAFQEIIKLPSSKSDTGMIVKTVLTRMTATTVTSQFHAPLGEFDKIAISFQHRTVVSEVLWPST